MAGFARPGIAMIANPITGAPSGLLRVQQVLVATGGEDTVVLGALPYGGVTLTRVRSGVSLTLIPGTDYSVLGMVASLVSTLSTSDVVIVDFFSADVRAKKCYLTSVSADPYFSDVVALLHFDGTNGGTSFPDVISANTWTPSSLTTNTTTKKFGSASGYFVRTNTSNLYLSTTSVGNVGSSDFTVEAWINPTTISTTSGQLNFIACKDDVSGGTRGWSLGISGNLSGKIAFSTFVSGTIYQALSSAAPTTSTWVHVAGVRSGQNIMLFVGGILQATTPLPTPSSTIGNPTYGIRIGSTSPEASVYSFDGYIDDFRMTIGVARYTSNFTPPTAAFPNF
jgi:hypothetical protein